MRAIDFHVHLPTPDWLWTAVRTSEDKHGGLSLFVIERGMEGFERGKQIEKLGQHASDQPQGGTHAGRPESRRPGRGSRHRPPAGTHARHLA